MFAVELVMSASNPWLISTRSRLSRLRIDLCSSRRESILFSHSCSQSATQSALCVLQYLKDIGCSIVSALSRHRRRSQRTLIRDDVCLSAATERALRGAESAVSAAGRVSTLSTQSAPLYRSHRVGCATSRTVLHYFAHICDRILVGGRNRMPAGCVCGVHNLYCLHSTCLGNIVLYNSTILLFRHFS